MALYTIELCGRLADRACAALTLELDAASCSVADLRAALAAAHPSLAADMANARVRACVDEVIVKDTFMVAAGQAIAFFPPVSGG
ncbi:MAG: MoaD/ThiS family protein [Pseudomonadota bacterium]